MAAPALDSEFELLDGTRHTEQQTFSAMASSHVLVSTSSSFSMAAASFAPVGAQLHFLFPPKEAIGEIMYRANALPAGLNLRDLNLPNSSEVERTSANAPTLPNVSAAIREAIRSTHGFRTYFMRRNTVPIDFAGHVFPEYGYKTSGMLAQLGARGWADPKLSRLHYETWM